MFHARQRGRTIAGEFFRDREARRGFGSSFGSILKFGFRTEKYGVPYFLTESEAIACDPRKEAVGARARNAVEDLNGGHRREALGGGRLSRRRHSCTEGRPWVRNGSGVSQTS